jgi:hypothetical protein
MRGILTPFGGGLQYETGAIPETGSGRPLRAGALDRPLGTRWEHKRGVLRIIRDDEMWEP